jgi:hypothetical protein
MQWGYSPFTHRKSVVRRSGSCQASTILTIVSFPGIPRGDVRCNRVEQANPSSSARSQSVSRPVTTGPTRRRPEFRSVPAMRREEWRFVAGLWTSASRPSPSCWASSRLAQRNGTALAFVGCTSQITIEVSWSPAAISRPSGVNASELIQPHGDSIVRISFLSRRR